MEQNTVSHLIARMISYEAGQPARIQHLLKVYAFAKAIGELEGLDARTQAVLEVAAVVHDIGIRPSLEKYGSSAGPYQEKEGPAPAAQMLASLGFQEDLIRRVCFLVGRHHTVAGVDGADYQILLEADFLVNGFEGNLSREQIRAGEEKIFRTQTGRRFLREMFAGEQPA